MKDLPQEICDDAFGLRASPYRKVTQFHARCYNPTVGPILYIFCFLVSAISVIALIVCFARAGTIGVPNGGSAWRFGWIGIPAAILVWGLVVAFVGVMEGQWTVRSPTVWLLFLLGLSGVWLASRAVWVAVKPYHAPGCCTKCGYEVGQLTRCPECGEPV